MVSKIRTFSLEEILDNSTKVAIKYQLHSIDALYQCPIRDTWEQAASDAEAHGVGRWKNAHEFEIDYGNIIVAVREQKL